MPVTALECPKCGATLAPVAGRHSYTCEYCGTRFTEAEGHRSGGAAARPTGGAAPGAGVGRVIAVAMATMTVLGVGAALFIGRQVQSTIEAAGAGARVEVPAIPTIPTIPSVPGMPVVPTGDGRILWDDVGGAPVAATVGGEAAVIGRVRAFPEDQLHIQVSRADDASAIYRVGPLGTYGDGYRATHFAVAGERLLVSDMRPEIHVHELASGKELKSFPLSDRVESLCVAGDGAVGVALVDERQLRIDPAGLTIEEGAPKGCAFAPSPFRHPEDAKGVKAPKVEGFRSRQLLREGEVAVANGNKDPGTAIPQAVGFDPKTGAKRWHEVVPSVAPATVQESSNEHAALAGGRFFTTYGVGSEETRVTAFDGMTGARLWDQKLRPIFAVDRIGGVVATERHVFVIRTSSLDILDAATGAPRGTVGDDTYDE